MAKTLLCGTQRPKSYSSKVFVNSKVIERLDKIETDLIRQSKQTHSLTESFAEFGKTLTQTVSVTCKTSCEADKQSVKSLIGDYFDAFLKDIKPIVSGLNQRITSIESKHNQLCAEINSLKDLMNTPKIEEESQTDFVLSNSESEMFLPPHTPEMEPSISPDLSNNFSENIISGDDLGPNMTDKFEVELCGEEDDTDSCSFVSAPAILPSSPVHPSPTIPQQSFQLSTQSFPPCPSGSSSLYNTPVWLSGQQVTVSGGAEPVPKVGAPFSQTSQFAEDHVTQRELLEVVKLAINCVSNVTSKGDGVDGSRLNNFVENFEPCQNFPGQQFFPAPKRRFRTKVFSNQKFLKIPGGNRGNQGYSNQEHYSNMFPYNPGPPYFYSSPSPVHFLDYPGTQQPQTIWNTAYRPRKFSF